MCVDQTFTSLRVILEGVEYSGSLVGANFQDVHVVLDGSREDLLQLTFTFNFASGGLVGLLEASFGMSDPCNYRLAFSASRLLPSS